MDFDGCLANEDRTDIHPDFIPILNDLRQRGHFVVLATGRRPHAVPKSIPPFFDGVVMANGAAVHSGDQRIYRSLTEKQVMTVAAKLEQLNQNYYVDYPDRTVARYLRGSSEEVLPNRRYDFRRIISFRLALRSLRDTASFLTLATTMRLSVLAWPRFDQEIVLELLPFGVTKFSGVQQCIKLLGIKKSQHIVAIGDGLNDLPSFLSADIAIGVGELDPAVQAVVHWRATTPDELANWLGKYGRETTK